MPVLSEHITLAPPNVSTAGNLLIMVFFLDILCIPIASTIVTIAGSPSGIAATAKLTDVINISNGSAFVSNPIQNITRQITKAPIPNIFPVCPNFFCNGV